MEFNILEAIFVAPFLLMGLVAVTAGPLIAFEFARRFALERHILSYLVSMAIGVWIIALFALLLSLPWS